MKEIPIHKKCIDVITLCDLFKETLKRIQIVLETNHFTRNLWFYIFLDYFTFPWHVTDFHWRETNHSWNTVQILRCGFFSRTQKKIFCGKGICFICSLPRLLLFLRMIHFKCGEQIMKIDFKFRSKKQSLVNRYHKSVKTAVYIVFVALN